MASGYGFTHRKLTLVDNRLLWDKTLEENFANVCKFLKTYWKMSLIVNGDKF